MYPERIENHLKILEEIENPLIEGQIGNLWIKGISNVSIVRKRNILDSSIKLNQRIKQGIELIIGMSDS